MRRLLPVLLFAFPAFLLADISGTVSLSANSTFNFDTGVAASSGGDVVLDAFLYTVSPQGKAQIASLVPSSPFSGEFTELGPSVSTAYSYSTSPVQIAPENNVSGAPKTTFAVHTNAGHYAKVLVTAWSATSVTLLYYTWNATGVPGVPSIMQLQNNYSYILPAMPNYGIAPGSLFIIQGVGFNNQPLSALQSSASPGLPLALGGTSVSVTVNGVTTHPAIYYTSPSQLGVVLPSTTPVGGGTVTVTNGTNSATAPIQVVASALGFDSLDGSGVGTAVATDANGNVFRTTNSAMPGQTIILWGSGVGADMANDDRIFPQQQNNLSNVPLQVYIGGNQANIAYRGRSQYPGVDQINVVVPATVQPGCFVSVMAVSGTMVSNSVTLPVAPGGGACVDPQFGIGAAQAQVLASYGAVNFGSIVVSPGSAAANFAGYPGGAFASYFGDAGLPSFSNGWGTVSIGGCVVAQPIPTSGLLFNPYKQSALDAGAITLTTGAGSETFLMPAPGMYQSPYGSKIPASGDIGTLDNGPGGKNIGHFSTTVTAPAPLIWSNQSAITSITRSQGLSITWTGGSPGTYVQIEGNAPLFTAAGWFFGGNFLCAAPVEAGQFTVPAAVLLALPPGSLAVGLIDSTFPQAFTAAGLDWGYAYGSNGSYYGTLIPLH